MTSNAIVLVLPDAEGKYHCPGCADVIVNPGVLKDLKVRIETKVHCGKAGRYYKIKADAA